MLKDGTTNVRTFPTLIRCLQPRRKLSRKRKKTVKGALYAWAKKSDWSNSIDKKGGKEEARLYWFSGANAMTAILDWRRWAPMKCVSI